MRTAPTMARCAMVGHADHGTLCHGLVFSLFGGFVGFVSLLIRVMFHRSYRRAVRIYGCVVGSGSVLCAGQSAQVQLGQPMVVSDGASQGSSLELSGALWELSGTSLELSGSSLELSGAL